jgi:hypothetical protein
VVDLAEIQTAYYMVAATGVLVAAGYYILNIRTNQRNQRIMLANSLMQSILTEERWTRYGELLNMSWGDYDDFEKKYGSDFNLENFSKRQSTFTSFDVVGNLVSSGLADFDTVYNTDTWIIYWIWTKFQSIIEEQRMRYSGGGYLDGFEYIAKRLLAEKRRREPGYVIPSEFITYRP